MKLTKKSVILIFFSIVTCFIIQAQVGIGTTNPQQELHIVGDGTETIRVDGLGITNSANNYGVNTSLPVHVDANGNMLIPNSPAMAEFAFNGQDIISGDIYVPTGPQGQASGVVQLYQTPSFTLTQPALVMVTYSMSAVVWNRAGTIAVDDGKPKVVNTFFYIGNGSTPDTSISYGRSSLNHSNFAPTSGNWITNGYFYSTAVDSIYLPAGTYSVHLNAFITATTGVTPLLNSDSFSVDFGGASREYLKVITFY